MAALSKNSKYWTVILAAAAGTILFLNLLIFPSLSKNSLLNTQISQEKARLGKYRWLLDNARQIKENYRKLPFSQANSGSEETSVSSLAQIDRLAKTANIVINEFRPEAQSQPNKISLSLRTEADIQGYFKFISQLESRPDLFSIDKFTLNAKALGPLIEGSFFITRNLTVKQ